MDENVSFFFVSSLMQKIELVKSSSLLLESNPNEVK